MGLFVKHEVCLKKGIMHVHCASLLMSLAILLSTAFSLSANNEPIAQKEIKVLVLIIASDNTPIYRSLQNIWRSYMHNDPEHIEAYFIKGNPDLSSDYQIEGDVIWSRTVENIMPGIVNKTILSLEALLPRIKGEFDYVLRTNLSSFYIFPRLLTFLKTCPTRSFYCSGGHAHFASGSGFLMSPDVVEMLLAHKNELINDTSGNDDVVIGNFLYQRGVFVTHHPRIDILNVGDWNSIKNHIPSDVFQLRVKNEDHVRLSDDLYIQHQLLSMFYS